jgi:hypothetical protein
VLPALFLLGVFAATMIACINAMVAGAGVTLFVHQLLGRAVAVALLIGTACAALLLTLFFVYQRYRITDLVDASEKATGRHAKCPVAAVHSSHRSIDD